MPSVGVHSNSYPRYRQVWHDAHADQRAYPIGQIPPYQIHLQPLPYVHRQYPNASQTPHQVPRSSDRKTPQYGQHFEDDFYDRRRYESALTTPAPCPTPLFQRLTVRQQQLDRMMYEQRLREEQLLYHHQQKQKNLQRLEHQKGKHRLPILQGSPSIHQSIPMLRQATTLETIQYCSGHAERAQLLQLQLRSITGDVWHHDDQEYGYETELSSQEIEEFAEWHMAYFETSVEDCQESDCQHDRYLREQYASFRASSYGSAVSSPVGPQKVAVNDGDRIVPPRTLSEQLLACTTPENPQFPQSLDPKDLIVHAADVSPVSSCQRLHENKQYTMVDPLPKTLQAESFADSTPSSEAYHKYLDQFGPWPKRIFFKSLKTSNPRKLMDGFFDGKNEPEKKEEVKSSSYCNVDGQHHNNYSPLSPSALGVYGSPYFQDSDDDFYSRQPDLDQLHFPSPDIEKLLVSQSFSPQLDLLLTTTDPNANLAVFDEILFQPPCISASSPTDSDEDTEAPLPCLICQAYFADSGSLVSHFDSLPHAEKLRTFLCITAPTDVRFWQIRKELEKFEAAARRVSTMLVRIRNDAIFNWGNSCPLTEIEKLNQWVKDFGTNEARARSKEMSPYTQSPHNGSEGEICNSSDSSSTSSEEEDHSSPESTASSSCEDISVLLNHKQQIHLNNDPIRSGLRPGYTTPTGYRSPVEEEPLVVPIGGQHHYIYEPWAKNWWIEHLMDMTPVEATRLLASQALMNGRAYGGGGLHGYGQGYG